MTETPLTNIDSREKIVSAINGWLMLFINCFLFLGGIALLVQQVSLGRGETSGWMIGLALFLQLLVIVLLCGHFALQPNEARVLLLFGNYHGTVRQSGFYWANPFYSPQSRQSARKRRRRDGRAS